MGSKRVSVRCCCAPRVAKPSLKRGLQTAGERSLGSPPCSDSCPFPIPLPGIPWILLPNGPASLQQGTSPSSFSALPVAPQNSRQSALVPRASCGSTQGLLGPVSPLLKPTWKSCMAQWGVCVCVCPLDLLLTWALQLVQLSSPTACCPAAWPQLWRCGRDKQSVRPLHHTDSAHALWG